MPATKLSTIYAALFSMDITTSHSTNNKLARSDHSSTNRTLQWHSWHTVCLRHIQKPPEHTQNHSKHHVKAKVIPPQCSVLPPRKDPVPTVQEAGWAQSGQHGKTHLWEDSIPVPSSPEWVTTPAMLSRLPQTLGHLSKLNTIKPKFTATVCSLHSDAVYRRWW